LRVFIIIGIVTPPNIQIDIHSLTDPEFVDFISNEILTAKADACLVIYIVLGWMCILAATTNVFAWRQAGRRGY